MHRFSVNYRERDGQRRGTLLNRGYFASSLPRLILACRLLGHRPVVDGTEGFNDRPGHRWVCCDRCGVRPDPQGHLDPDRWDIGDRYDGPLDGVRPPYPSREEIKQRAEQGLPLYEREPVPGPWPGKPTGDVGAQLIIGKSFPGWDAELKIGNAGSEHTLAAHLRLHPFGAIYLHTERFGTWLQRRLNPTGYESRVISLGIQHGGIDWKLWAKRDESSRDDPWWMRGTIKLDPRDRLFGRSRYEYEDIGEPLTVTVRMPHGDDHEVRLKLQKCTDGRNRRRFHSWTVDWFTRPGIPTKQRGRGLVLGSAVDVSAASVEGGTWPAEAAAAIAARMTADRTQYGYRPRIAAVTEDFDVEVD
ncbi:hypothetical protein [Streptomyces spinosisporus]|uniref:Uncharacterized protein n=1 Tax=Streptomyces spinosisporus TaxID=2927582 RepID=A0ABS9XW18_9ACTN|nr:hypothetical protein [Streptomyces spinosisporus]MCI3246283.1 hypothetical protein [Streptomyces spinosisporus]